MTTLTTTQPTSTSTALTGSRTWRYVATFAAGVVLSIGVAAGITAATDDPAPAPSSPTSPAITTHVSSANDQCALRAGKPC